MRTVYNKYPELKGMTDSDKNKVYWLEFRKRYPDRGLYRAAKARAKKREMEFDIEFEDIVIPDKCPILGIPIICNISSGRGGKMNSASLDRIDNTKGYVKGNVQVISHKANSMKFTATPEELLMFADWIYKTYKGNT